MRICVPLSYIFSCALHCSFFFFFPNSLEVNNNICQSFFVLSSSSSSVLRSDSYQVCVCVSLIILLFCLNRGRPRSLLLVDYFMSGIRITLIRPVV